MTQSNNRTILLFKSIHEVMVAEKLITELKYHYQIVPVPTNISSECGMCIEIDDSLIVSLLPVFQQHNIEPKVANR